MATVSPGEGLALQFVPADGPLESCSIRLSGLLSSIDLKPNEDNPQNVSYWGRGLEQGDCGVIVHSFDPKIHSGSWIFQVTPVNGSKRSSTAKINSSGKRNLRKFKHVKTERLDDTIQTSECQDTNHLQYKNFDELCLSKVKSKNPIETHFL